MLATRDRHAGIGYAAVLTLFWVLVGCGQDETFDYAPEHRLVSVRMNATDIRDRVVKYYNFEFGLSSDEQPQVSAYDISFSASFPTGDTLKVRQSGATSLHQSSATTLSGIKDIPPAITHAEILRGQEAFFVVHTTWKRIVKCRIRHANLQDKPIVLEYELYRDPTPDLTLN